jgi:hypothetical protein
VGSLPEAPKPVGTARLVMAGISLLKDLFAVAAATVLEWSRIKARQAEDRAAVAETELKVQKQKAAMEAANVQKDPGQTVDDFLAGKP